MGTERPETKLVMVPAIVARGHVDDVIPEGPDNAPELILFIHAELVEGLAVCVVQCINC
mgnify:CR=1 FL=1